MNTSVYIAPEEILSVATAMVADMDYKVIHRGFYTSLIQKAFEELALDTFFQELRADFDFPTETLTHSLPEGCFNVQNVYLFDGENCNINNSYKVWWKRNYFTTGNGYIANDKGNNHHDPYYQSDVLSSANANKSLIRYDAEINPNRRLYYNFQMGNIMFSSSCRNKAPKVHIHYNGTGCAIGEAPIIPVYLRTAMEDYVIEAALRFRMANDNDPRRWQALWNIYVGRLDKEGYNGSWHRAESRVKALNASQREELKEYLGRGGWATGF